MIGAEFDYAGITQRVRKELQDLIEKSGISEQKRRSEMTPAERAAYIRQFGGVEYLKLPD